MADGAFIFDPTETFPSLSRPPIVEAVIHWQAVAQNVLEPDALRTALLSKLPIYSQSAVLQRYGLMAKLPVGDDTPAVEHQKKGFAGLRLTSNDGCNVLQFKRDGLIFSQTKSYQHWEAFSSAALEAWKVYVEIAAPTDIQRLGVRYINQLAAATPQTLDEFLRDPPTCPSGLPLKEFVYQSTFSVPARAYGIRVIKILQPSLPEFEHSSGLFVDIDVYSTKAIPIEEGATKEALAEMRWLKNKVFFTLLTDNVVNSFK